MKIPPGYSYQGENQVCKLNKSLYGLKQAGRNWFQKFSQALLDVGFTQSRADYSLFFRIQGTSQVFILVYVNDIVLTGNDTMAIDKLKSYLHSKFHIKDLGPLKYFLALRLLNLPKASIFHNENIPWKF